jgi:hypothetical protein
MPRKNISQPHIQTRYNLRSSKQAGVNNSGQPDTDRQILNTSNQANGHESTGEPSQASATEIASQAGRTELVSQTSGIGKATQTGDVGMASQVYGVGMPPGCHPLPDDEGIPLPPEIGRSLIARGFLTNEFTPDPISTDEEMEQAGFGDLTWEFRARAQYDSSQRAWVEAWDSIGWDGKLRQR